MQSRSVAHCPGTSDAGTSVATHRQLDLLGLFQLYSMISCYTLKGVMLTSCLIPFFCGCPPLQKEWGYTADIASSITKVELEEHSCTLSLVQNNQGMCPSDAILIYTSGTEGRLDDPCVHHQSQSGKKWVTPFQTAVLRR